MSHGYLQALQHLSDGVLDPDTVEPYWYEVAVQQPKQSSIIEMAVVGLQNLPQAFAQARPQHNTYQALRDILKNSDALIQTNWGAQCNRGGAIVAGWRV